MNTYQLTGHPKAKAVVQCFPDGRIKLFSYDTLAAEITQDRWFKIHNWSSTTTRKHITWFMKEYCKLDKAYDTAKALFTNGFTMNLNTGEVIVNDE